MSGTVVIAIDDSDFSARALPIARHIAQLWHGHLILAHGTPHRQAQLDIKPLLLEQELRDEGVDAEAFSITAPPAQAIVDIARERDAELIVMATHQRRGLDRWLHGSVTEEVLSRTPTPLLVVPAHAELAMDGKLRVLMPLDGSRVGEAALSFLRRHSTSRPLELRLVRFVSVTPFYVGVETSFAGYQLTPAEIDAEVASATDYLSEQARTIIDPRIDARHEVLQTSDSIARSILDVAQAGRADMIAIGTHAKAGVARLILGSISEEVLERSLVPVLLVRQGGSTASASTQSPCRLAEPSRRRTFP
jgi:nucleotide-binding universal stress UspA family protein